MALPPPLIPHGRWSLPCQILAAEERKEPEGCLHKLKILVGHATMPDSTFEVGGRGAVPAHRRGLRGIQCARCPVQPPVTSPSPTPLHPGGGVGPFQGLRAAEQPAAALRRNCRHSLASPLPRLSVLRDVACRLHRQAGQKRGTDQSEYLQGRACCSPEWIGGKTPATGAACPGAKRQQPRTGGEGGRPRLGKGSFRRLAIRNVLCSAVLEDAITDLTC